MAHHGGGESPLTDEFLRTVGKLGATGKYPQGKLNEHDEGEIRLAVGRRGDKVFLDFGKSVAWIGFDAEQAESLADLIREHARELRLRR